MTIEEAYDKATQYGYSGRLFAPTDSNVEFLDPSFWQSFGKAMGWSQDEIGVCGNCGARKEKDCSCIDGSLCPVVDEWLYQWHRFIDHLAKGKTAEDFFAELSSRVAPRNRRTP